MHHSPLTTYHSPRRSRGAFTLVEMLIAMTLTLMLVYAIASFYAYIGDAVKDGRAMIELNGALRAAVERLKSDLDQVTVPVVPWADEGGAAGYFEVFEGPGSDWDVNGNFQPDAEFEAANKVDNNLNGTPDWEETGVSNLLGDLDDVIAMTIRAAGAPFAGQSVQTNINTGFVVPATGGNLSKSSNPPLTKQITSPYAEVVWWTGFGDAAINNGNTGASSGQRWWDLTEPRFIYRRQLLIRPDLNVVHSGDVNAGPYFFKLPLVAGLLTNYDYIFIYDIFQYCDVSMRPDFDLSAAMGGNSIYFVANSLADLAKRENRFMHQWKPDANGNFNGLVPQHRFPYALDLNPNYAGTQPPNVTPPNPRHPSTLGNLNAASQYRWVLYDGGRQGEDVVLSNVLGFDVRVYDPEAVVRVDNPGNPTTTLSPGDPGYVYAIANNFQTTHAPFALLGTGAYVDLGYGIALANLLPNLASPNKVPANQVPLVLYGNYNSFCPVLGNSRFAGPPSVAPIYATNAATIALGTQYQNRIGRTYDTWTVLYERDGVNQNVDAENALSLNPLLIDEGTDGLDNANAAGNYVNGVDDVTERETVPPYSHPLRGIQVRIRLYEPGTRQMRQATVEADFISE